MSGVSFCLECKRKSCLKTKKPCKKVEKLLPNPNAGKLSGEILLDSLYMDQVLVKGDLGYKFKQDDKLHEDT